MPKYDNFLILGDFNSEMSEDAMRDFSETYNLSNLINERTCFKNLCNPSLIDLILTDHVVFKIVMLSKLVCQITTK